MIEEEKRGVNEAAQMREFKRDSGEAELLRSHRFMNFDEREMNEHCSGDEEEVKRVPSAKGSELDFGMSNRRKSPSRAGSLIF